MTRLELDWSAWDGPLAVVRRLRKHGHEAWLAGGCVRDLLLGTAPKDYDIATSAEPAQVMEIFTGAVALKPELGVVLVPKGQPIEVTSFRSEGPYLDGRRPSWVERTTAIGDVQRRDFTINGMLLDAETGEVIDHVGGMEDLRAGLLRCIRDPRERFLEDHLRLLRAVRFSTRLGFAIDPDTWKAVCELSGEVVTLSGERLHEELGRMFSQGPFLPCLRLLRESGILAALFPELDAALSEPLVRDRMERLFGEVWPEEVPWFVGFGLALCPWMAQSTFAERSALFPQAEGLLDRLRASNHEKDAARLVWTRFPELFAPGQKLSQKASLVRERHYPALVGLLACWEERIASTGLREAWQDACKRVASAQKPPVGHVWMAADPRVKGARVGEAMRLADAILLDQGPCDSEVLVKQVLGTMFGDG